MIYILFSCDGQKSSSSMSFITITKSLRKIKKDIILKIKQEQMYYERCSKKPIPINKQIKCLKKDWKKERPEFCFSHLKYGYVKSVDENAENI